MAGILTELGYGAIDQRADLSSWVRGFDRVDLIHAQRPIARALLSAAPLARYLDLALNVVDVEGILGLKIQAYSDDPRRLRDLADIQAACRTLRVRCVVWLKRLQGAARSQCLFHWQGSQRRRRCDAQPAGRPFGIAQTRE